MQLGQEQGQAIGLGKCQTIGSIICKTNGSGIGHTIGSGKCHATGSGRHQAIGSRIGQAVSQWVKQLGQSMRPSATIVSTESKRRNRMKTEEASATDLNDESLVAESRRNTDDAHVVSAVDKHFDAMVDALQCNMHQRQHKY